MKTFLFLLFLNIVLLSQPVSAECFLTSELDQDGNKVVVCAQGFQPQGVICSTPLFSGKQYKIGADLIDEGDGTCSIDMAARGQRLAAEAATQTARDNAEAARASRLDNIKNSCASASGLLKDICEHVSGL
jgi:hypothetical protein